MSVPVKALYLLADPGDSPGFRVNSSGRFVPDASVVWTESQTPPATATESLALVQPPCVDGSGVLGSAALLPSFSTPASPPLAPENSEGFLTAWTDGLRANRERAPIADHGRQSNRFRQRPSRSAAVLSRFGWLVGLSRRKIHWEQCGAGSHWQIQLKALISLGARCKQTWRFSASKRDIEGPSTFSARKARVLKQARAMNAVQHLIPGWRSRPSRQKTPRIEKTF